MHATLKNNFHHTEVCVRPLIVNGRHYLSSGQVKRARNALCGIEGCTCGGEAGERGPQNGFHLETDGADGAELIYNP